MSTVTLVSVRGTVIGTEVKGAAQLTLIKEK
jgi:hypothetical protein